jgi:hypothetical protein
MSMDDGELIPLVLAKEGFGRPDEIETMRADLVLGALELVNFRADYAETAEELNRQT